MTVEATQIWGPIYQGSWPKTGTNVANSGFKVLVLSAKEYQPASALFPRVAVVHAPIADAEPSPREYTTVMRAAQIVAQAANQHLPVLVTCQQGRNRSGLIVGLAIYYITGNPGDQIVKLIQSRRPNALTNLYFANFLKQLPLAR